MKVAILGRQNPFYFRQWMQARLQENGHEAELRDMETRNFLDFADQLAGYDAIIICGEKLPDAAVKVLGAGQVQLISRWGVGTDEIDKAQATRQGIAVCNAAGSLSVAVAECALTMMLNLLREFPARDASVRQGDWSWFFEGRVSHQIEGKTVGLMGFGDIAKALCKMLMGFDCRVIAYDVHWDEAAAARLGVEWADPETIRRTADIVSLHIPATPETRDMVNMAYLKEMKPTAILINTARGALIVEEDLAEALRTGVIAAAGLDVFRQEPPARDNPLLSLPNVMVLPHAGAASWECLEKSSALAVQNWTIVNKVDK